MGARGGRARGKAADLEPSDRETAKAALRRALDSNNAAAVVAAAQWLIKFDTSPDHEQVTVDDAREALLARFNEIDARRRERGKDCPTCGGCGYILDEPGRGRGARIGGGRGVDARVKARSRDSFPFSSAPVRSPSSR
jgi:hypothetical protein